MTEHSLCDIIQLRQKGVYILDIYVPGFSPELEKEAVEAMTPLFAEADKEEVTEELEENVEVADKPKRKTKTKE
nr:MAG TPA: hypothetical protein [Caudoviricetes sp.]